MTYREHTTNFFLETQSLDNGDSPKDNGQKDDIIVSEEALHVLEIIFYACLTGVISVIGVGTNTVNIIIFCKQGFQDSVNISLCSLAVADIGSLLFLVWRSICFNPLFQASNVGFDYVQLQQVTAGWPHGLFVRITSWITAFITFERCVCIALPLKVKYIITPKRTFLSICAIFSIIIATIAPVFCTFVFTHNFDGRTNTTFIEIFFTASGRDFQNIAYFLSAISHFFSFVSVMLFTAVLMHNLINHSKRRHKAMVLSSSATLHRLSTRDTQVVIMVLSIAIVFIMCFLPNFIHLLMAFIITEYIIGGRYQNAFILARAIHNTLEAVNSSINILVFYKTSCNFRAAFNKLFGCGRGLKGE